MPGFANFRYDNRFRWTTTNKPDITVRCDRTNTYLDVRSLPYHRSYLEALDLFEYTTTNKPEDVEELLTRRNLVMRKMKVQHTADKPLRIHYYLPTTLSMI